ncbi:MAG: LysM peptidoglycan-binding domain-containing protein [Acidiferrobacterales bacterium]
MTRLCFVAIAALATSVAFAADALTLFPRPPELEPDVRFWTRVYTEVDTNGGFVHDARHLDVVYEVIRFPSELREKARRRRVEEVKRRYKAILRTLARGKREALTKDEQRVLALWPEDVSSGTLRAAARRLRFQLGQADRFREGLIRSGAWEPYIRATLADMDLPVELVALPHVESSYNPKAYSRVGAAGLWQLTRSTGRRFLRVDGTVDERLDPYSASVAAGRLLKQNRSVTGSWPLAITAYNHGAAGMRRAVRKVGTHDIVTIVRQYKSRTFGFASRNFYPAFLAAVDAHFNAEKYFGSLRRDEPVESEVVKIPAYITVGTLTRALGVDRAFLRQHNPALRPAVWRGAKYIPRGYELRLPRGLLREPADVALARIETSERYPAQQRDRYYRVRYGDTLSEIATRLGVSEGELVAFNGLGSRHRIHAGQVLRLPPSEPSSPAILASVQPARAELPGDGLYEVQPGDTLSIIARRFDVSEQALAAANELPSRHRIRVGQVLQVAVAQSATAATSTPRSPTVGGVDEEPAAEPELTPTEVATVESAEPASVDEAEALGPTLPPAVHPALAADPSDYSVASDGTIEVQAAETLGHYAEWLEIRAADLRRVNRMRYGRPVVVGHRLKLDFTYISPESFEQRRFAYHRSLQEAFFAQYQITGTHEHLVRRGESVWILSKHRYNIPFWLLRQYNPDLDPHSMLPGTSIIIPLVKARDEAAPDPDSEPPLRTT